MPPFSFSPVVKGRPLCHDVTRDAEAPRVAARRPPSPAQLMMMSWVTKLREDATNAAPRSKTARRR